MKVGNIDYMVKKIIKKFVPDFLLQRYKTEKIGRLIASSVLAGGVVMDDSGYKKQSLDLLEKYSVLEFCYLDTTRIANMIELLIETHDNRFGNKETLNVFIPVFYTENAHRPVIYFAEERVANQYLFSRMKEKLTIVTKENMGFWYYFFRHYKAYISFYDRYSHQQMMTHGRQDILSNYKFRKVYMNFTVQEIYTGEKEIQKMGLHKEFVCFFARSSRYLQTVLDTKTLDPSNTSRNYSVENFRLMAKELFKHNILSVRMGYLVEGNMEEDGVIDYANLYRTEFLDFYLVMRCKFVICGLNGFFHIAFLLNKPCVIVNAELFSLTGDLRNYFDGRRDIMIPKKRWDSKRNRFLSFQEIFSIEKKLESKYLIANYYQENKIELIENTAEEINDIVQEMLERMNGLFTYTKEDEILQQRYKELLYKCVEGRACYYSDLPVGKMFLRQNEWMLD